MVGDYGSCQLRSVQCYVCSVDTSAMLISLILRGRCLQLPAAAMSCHEPSSYVEFTHQAAKTPMEPSQPLLVILQAGAPASGNDGSAVKRADRCEV